MGVVAIDDGWVRTHDEVSELLRYAVPGADVRLSPVALPGNPRGNARARCYQISLRRIGRDPVPTADTYTLPCLAAPLARRARELADNAEKLASIARELADRNPTA